MEKPLLNKIYTWPLAIGLPKNPVELFNINNMFISMLIQESAYEIIMPKYESFFKAYYGDQMDFENGLPEIFTQFVRFVDDSKLQQDIHEFMLPILTNENPKYPGSSNIVEGTRLFWSLYILASSIKYRAQADIDINEVKKNISVVTPKMKDKEAKYRLSAISGIFNLYEHRSLPVACIKEGCEQYISDKMEIVLKDNNFELISFNRHNLGFVDKQIESLKNIPKIFQNFISSKKILKYLKKGSKKLSIAINTPIISLSNPLTEIIYKEYNPVLISLKNIRWDVLKNQTDDL